LDFVGHTDAGAEESYAEVGHCGRECWGRERGSGGCGGWAMCVGFGRGRGSSETEGTCEGQNVWRIVMVRILRTCTLSFNDAASSCPLRARRKLS
jgi:hypothetical protein